MVLDSYLMAVPSSTLPVRAQEVRTAPLERQLSFLLGKEASSWRDIESELRSNEVYLKDAEFFLSPNRFEEFRETRRLIQEAQAKGLPIWKIPTELLVKEEIAIDLVREKKHEFLQGALAELHYQELGRIFDNYASKLSDQKITYGDAEKLLASLGENLPTAIAEGWASDLKQYNGKVAATIDEDFQASMPKEFVGHFSCNPSWRYFPIVKVGYELVSIDTVNLKAEIYVVANVEITAKGGRHFWTVAGITYPLDMEEITIGHYAKLFTPNELGLGRFQLARLPLKLVQGLCDGKLEPEGCHVVQREQYVTYAIEGYKEAVVLREKTIAWLRSWAPGGGWRGLLDTLRKVGSVDDITYEILQNRIKEPVRSVVSSSVSHAIKTSVKDLKKLETIYRANVSDPLTYGEWARILGIGSRQGADAWLRRMQSQGNLRLEKVDRGIKAIITRQAKDALKAMPPSGRKIER